MTTVTAVSDGAGALKPSTIYQNHYGADYNGTSFCYILDADLVNPDLRALNAPHGRVIQLVNGSVTVPADFLGLHFHRIYNNTTTWPSDITPSFVRSHDSGLRWQEIQPSNGSTYDWTRLDNWLYQVEQHGATPIFTVFGSPAWASARSAEASAYGINGLAAEPTNMSDLSTFVTAVATRYGTRIKHYEVWNEPNLTGFYTGTKAKLVDMVKTVSVAVKAVVPTAKIICPSVTSFTEVAGSNGETYLTALLTQQDTAASGTMLTWIDIVGVHLYRNAETFPLYGAVTRIKSALTAAGYGSLELWDTENGILSPYPTNFSSADHAKILKRKIATVACSGLKKMIWYAYDNVNMGFDGNEIVKKAYRDVQKELCGKTIVKANKMINGALYIKLSDNTELYY